jgi:sugar phosphate isomerase/epimerase
MEESMGVQTLLMRERDGRTDAQAIAFAVNRIKESGFKAIEIVPAQFQTVTGKEAAVFLEKAFDEKERSNLRDLLRGFSVITVHGSNIVLRVPPLKDKIAADLWLPYVELMRFAHDIGAHLVTFHSLQPAEGAGVTDEEMADSHVAFGQMAAEYASQWNIQAGFEMATRYKFFLEYKIIDRIGSRRFGVLFDVGHVALYFPTSPDITASVLRVVEESIDHIFEFHAGGVNRTAQGLREHRPLDEHNILDHGKLMTLLGRRKYRGPVIFEIFFEPSRPEQTHASFSENLAVCLAAKKQLLKG